MPTDSAVTRTVLIVLGIVCFALAAQAAGALLAQWEMARAARKSRKEEGP